MDKPAGLPTFPQLRSHYDDEADPGNQPIYTLDVTHTFSQTVRPYRTMYRTNFVQQYRVLVERSSRADRTRSRGLL